MTRRRSLLLVRRRLFFPRRFHRHLSGSRRPLRRLRRPSLARGRYETPNPMTPRRLREGRPGWRSSGGDVQLEPAPTLMRKRLESGLALAAAATRARRRRCHSVEAVSDAAYRSARAQVICVRTGESAASGEKCQERESEKRARERRKNPQNKGRTLCHLPTRGSAAGRRHRRRLRRLRASGRGPRSIGCRCSRSEAACPLLP